MSQKQVPKRIEVLKRKATSFFPPAYKAIIDEAVHQVHRIAQHASYLIKAYYLHCMKNHEMITIDKELIELCFSVVQGKHVVTRISKATNKTEAKRLEEERRKEYVDKHQPQLQMYYSTHFTPLKFDNKISLSYILAYSVQDMVTAYNNNIDMSYEKYVARILYYTIVSTYGCTKAKGNPKIYGKATNALLNHLLYGCAYNVNLDLSMLDIERIHDLCIVPRLSTKNLEDHIQENRSIYLEKMVNMNISLERDFPMLEGVKLFSPLCLRSSMTPSFIRIDTNAIAHLFIDNNNLSDFVDYYNTVTEDVQICNLQNKAQISSSLASLTGNPVLTDQQKAMYASRIWDYFCCFYNKKHKDIIIDSNYQNVMLHSRKDGYWVFDNMVLTDGTSICFQVTPIEHFKRPEFGKKGKQKKKNTDNEFPGVDSCQDDDSFKVSIDPGKRDLCAFTDGFNTLTYTSGMRNQDTYKNTRDRVSLKKRRKYIMKQSTMSVHKYESEILSLQSKKTCVLENFEQHLEHRKQYETDALLCYKNPYFRQAKFLLYCCQKSSIDRLINRVKETYLTSNIKDFYWMDENNQVLQPIYENMSKDRSKLTILYGDWGKHTNMKNSAPSPGIGLRRKIHKKINTVTTPEHGTSIICPCCNQKSMENPHLRSERPVKESYVPTKHHLLRCTNVDCQSRWWNRNVSASFNILLRGLRIIHSNCSSQDHERFQVSNPEYLHGAEDGNVLSQLNSNQV